MASPVYIFVLSLLAFPMTYITNTTQTLHGELGLFVSGAVCLSVMGYLTYLVMKRIDDGSGAKKKGSKDWLLYVFTLGTFASAVDLIIGLETDGYISGFMSVYLRNGEPYLGTPYGALISYWDGTAHYAMYLFMLIAMSYRWNYRLVGLYWAGSIGHSMLVLIPGAVIGKFGVRWSFLLNVPYIVIPFVSAARFLREGQAEKQKKKTEGAIVRSHSSLWRRPVDLTLVLFLATAIAVCLLRGFAVLGCKHKIATDYLNFYEPYLKDPVAFPKVQMLVFFFYFIPYFVAAVYGLLHSGCAWMPDWAVLVAGASAQAQIPHILGSMHYRTPTDFQVPRHESALAVFWCVNLLLLIVPHLLAARCLLFPRRFIASPASESTASDEGKRKPHSQ